MFNPKITHGRNYSLFSGETPIEKAANEHIKQEWVESGSALDPTKALIAALCDDYNSRHVEHMHLWGFENTKTVSPDGDFCLLCEQRGR